MEPATACPSSPAAASGSSVPARNKEFAAYAEQPRTGHDTPRTTTSGAAGDGARSGNGPHGPDHRTTPARMARCQLFNLSTCAVHNPACGPGLPPRPWRLRLITGWTTALTGAFPTPPTGKATRYARPLRAFS